MEIRNLAERYDLPALDWAGVTAALDAGFTQAPGTGGPDRHTCWLTTLDGDGAPHTTGIGAMWFERTFWFETGETTRKGRNLARDPRCSLALALRGYDVVVEGVAALVQDPATVARLAAVWAADGWPAQVDGSGTALTAEYSAPSAGGPPWRVYRVDVRAVTALHSEEPGGATRFVL